MDNISLITFSQNDHELIFGLIEEIYSSKI